MNKFFDQTTIRFQKPVACELPARRPLNLFKHQVLNRSLVFSNLEESNFHESIRVMVPQPENLGPYRSFNSQLLTQLPPQRSLQALAAVDLSPRELPLQPISVRMVPLTY